MKDIVIIYEDPFTKQKPEGRAELIKFIGWDSDGVGRHLVHFVGDPKGENFERVIVEDKS